MNFEDKEEYINCSGMGILTVEEKLKDFASRGNIGELTVESSDGGHWHSYFNVEDWKEFKDSVNTHAAITKVWIKEVPSRLAESSKTFRHPNVTLGTCDCGSKTKYTFRQRIERDGYSSKDAESMADFADEDLDNEMCFDCYLAIRDDWCQYTGRDKLKEAKENHTDLKEFLRKEADETELFDEKDILKFEKSATDSDWECLKDLKAKTENPEYDSPDCWAEIDQAVADIVLYNKEEETISKHSGKGSYSYYDGFEADVDFWYGKYCEDIDAGVNDPDVGIVEYIAGKIDENHPTESPEQFKSLMRWVRNELPKVEKKWSVNVRN